MNHLSEAQKKRLKEMLLEEKKELTKHFEINDETAAGLEESLRDSTGELSAADNHPGDLGTEVFERGRDIAVNETLDGQLEQVGKALARMEEGTYGTCEVCGEGIPFERLEALPFSAVCIEHADAGSDPDRRPVEEEVMTRPPAGAGEGRQAASGRFDDADAWESVESYGNSDSPAMAAARDVSSYDQLSSDKLDGRGHVEEIEKFTGSGIDGKDRHVQKAAPYKEYVDKDEAKPLLEDRELRRR
ncbi:TraR/DksA C4-type zinc finger protein [Paenibacillus mucilaginosus]|uniref:TraR/DksA family transcriptional regulator n=2 Tax=Paenibacillus mucilaginosus TaxID=61624 RepID=H6NN62_9BACL|nr:TraR/DksA C4-type zinc finger protein [Paenibacillus mucilaginosus]AEI44186.1 transcriptional regulator, TraR/DksA family [Paenibacillus mucilaginosus KNP414]AFC31738.1 TraR/DksA family transcriptional regulator [Paenibacillus mucilaginosus 3016]MCG7212355.1 TraR/DksA C4-type zinc finger protein [Paenibacillus mucilaginosus]WDM25601.1 TraR/DksA C4-type zinc finger protein [Paenibacillus mucilaginosus]WFA20261.1 conjugal transfer protein TraR [Paenibacillus mucilaginosus]